MRTAAWMVTSFPCGRCPPWQHDPERLYSQAERRELVEKGVMRHPPKYRVVVILRDIEQLSTEEAAHALGPRR